MSDEFGGDFGGPTAFQGDSGEAYTLPDVGSPTPYISGGVPYQVNPVIPNQPVNQQNNNAGGAWGFVNQLFSGAGQVLSGSGLLGPTPAQQAAAKQKQLLMLAGAALVLILVLRKH